MRNVEIPTNKVGRASRAPARTLRHRQAYHRPCPASRPKPKIPAKTPSRRPGSCGATALALLVSVLALQDGDKLGPRQQTKAWRNAERWVAEIVSVRRMNRAEVAA